MLKTVSKSSFFPAFLFTVVFASLIYFIDWNSSVKLLGFLNQNWFSIIIVLSVLLSLFRKYVQNKEFRFITIFSIYYFLYLFFFKTVLFGYPNSPTLYFLLGYFFFASIYSSLLMDLVINLINRINNKLKFTRKFYVKYPFYILLTGFFVFYLQPSNISFIINFYRTSWIWIVFLMPVILMIVDSKNKEKGRYYQGVIIYLVNYTVLFFYFIDLKLRAAAIVSTLLISTEIFRKYKFLRKFFLDKKDKIVQQKSTKIKSKAENIYNAVLKFFTSVWNKTAEFAQKLPARMKTNKRKLLTALAVVLVILLVMAFPSIKRLFTVNIIEFSPSGQVSGKIVVRAVFSADIYAKVSDINKLDCFIFNPQIEGEYRIEGKRTIVFLPKEELKRSAVYEVKFDSKNIGSATKKVDSGRKIRFYTELFRINSVRTFYVYDIATNTEKKIMGEINFNYPVDIESLKQSVEISYESGKIDVEFEKSYLPTRFYFKTGIIKRAEKEQKIEFIVKKGLNCLEGSAPIDKDYTKTISLAPKEKFTVSEVKLWHEPGNTMITVLFNMPVSQEQAKQFISVTTNFDQNNIFSGLMPAKKQVQYKVYYNVDAEYCYAVLRGNFQPNITYNVIINSGMVSKTGEILEKKYAENITINDLPPQIKFANKGKILPLNGEMNIAVKTINLDDAYVTIQKIYRNNLIQFINNEDSSPMSSHIFSGNYKVEKGRINEEVEQYINLRKFHNAPYKGLFRIDMNDSRNYGARDSSWFICTDIGLIAKNSGNDLMVYVLSIMNLNPKEGVTVKLISTNNQVIEEHVTSEDGTVVFKNWQKERYDFHPYYITAEKGDDFSFMNFNSSTLNQHRFPIGGIPYSERGMEAFIMSERGVYRPGEKAYISAIIRNRDYSTPPALHSVLIVTDPRGAEFKRIEKKWNDNGVACFEVDFPSHALTGEYSIRLVQGYQGYQGYYNEHLGSYSIKVEEFIPDKLKVEIEPGKEQIESGNLLVFSVKAKQMFGPPASGGKVMTILQYMQMEFTHPDFKGYKFSDHTKQFNEEVQRLGEDRLNEAGEKKYEVEIPRMNPPSALSAYVYTEVFDSGGRPVSAAKSIPVHIYPYYLGLKIQKEPFYKTGDLIKVDYVAINPYGKIQKVKNVQILVKRKVWYSIFRTSEWGRSGYDSSAYEEVIIQKIVDIDNKGSFTFKPDVAGEYFVFIGNEDSMRSGINLNVVGTGYQTWGLESPDKLEIKADKNLYSVGDEAIVTVRAPFKGKLFLTIEREKIYYTKIVDMTKNTAEISIPVKADYLPNVYIVGMLVRKPDEKNTTLPMASFGIADLNVSKATKLVGIKIDSSDSVESKQGIDVTAGLSSFGKNTDVMLAAVDQGILQITNFKTPDPLEFFYRKNALTTQSYSIFDLVLPDIKADKYAIGGDGGDGFTRRHLNPIAAKKPKSFAIFSGLLKPDETGKVKFHFDTSEFIGEARIMAVAVSDDKFGSISKNVIVIDPLVVMANFPRFAGPNDQFEIPVQVYNNTGEAGNFTASIECSGPVEISSAKEQSVFLANKFEKKIVFTVQSKNDAGVAKFTIRAKGSKHETERKAEVGIRPYSHLETDVKYGKLNPKASEKIKVPSSYIPYGLRIRLTLSSNPLVLYLRSMDYLLTYPYGCAEQKTSKLFPLIFFKDLGFATGIFSEKANAVDRFIQDGISDIEKLILQNGSVSMWPGGPSSDKWLCLYVAHFMAEAAKQGYNINPSIYNRIAAYVKNANIIFNEGAGRLDRRNNNVTKEVNVYALYISAIMKMPNREMMNFVLDNRLESLDEVDRSLLSLAYSEIGDTKTALKILKPDFKSIFVYREQFGSFNSPIRNTAMYLLALAYASPDSPKIKEIVKYLGENMTNGHFGNTQENAWTLMAMGKALKATDYEVLSQLMVDNKIYKDLKGKTDIISDKNLIGKTIDLRNTGKKESYFNFMAEGVPLAKNKKSSFNGIEISRKFYDENGNSVNLSNVVQGQLIVATVTVKAVKKDIHNVVIVDLLPGGLEVENPRISSRGSLKFQPEMTMSPGYQDIRDDRILTFVDELSGTRSYSYTMRAITPGRFSVPNIYAEAMYDPDINGEEYQKDNIVVVPNN